MLGCHICGLVHRCHQAVYRRNVDDPAPVPLEHLRQHRTSGQEYCGQVDRDHGIPALDREFVHWRNMLDARVVDEHVDASELARRMLDQPRGSAGLERSAALKATRTPWVFGDLLAQLLDRCGIAEAVDHEIGARSGKRARDPEPCPST